MSIETTIGLIIIFCIIVFLWSRIEHILTFFDYLFNPDEYQGLGEVGERLTYRLLKNYFLSKNIIRNVYLPKKNGELTEIDMVVVARRAILVIESKNYGGWIFGNEADKNWTQTFPNGKKVKFFSPIIQNKVHIDALNLLLTEHPALPVYSVIIFGNRCVLKDVTVSTANIFVLQHKDVNRFIKETIDKLPKIINSEQQSNIIKKLTASSRPDESIVETHLQQLENKANICPRCKSTLVERTAKQSGKKFWGCEKFPKCKYSKDM